MDGRKINWRRAAGAAANGFVIGAAKGALVGSGVGVLGAFATDFAAGTIGNALEQRITEGRVNLWESLRSGAGNALSEVLYGTGPVDGLKDAFIRGARTGAMMSGLENITDHVGPYGVAGSRILGKTPKEAMIPEVTKAGRDPKGMCGASDPFDLSSGLGNGRGYQNGRTHGRTGRSQTGENGGFSLVGFVRDVVTGAVAGGLGSAGFYGAGKAVDALWGSVAGRGSGEVSVSDSYRGVKEASEYLKSKGVPRKYRKQVLESFDVETISLKMADENTFGMRFYGGKAEAEGRYLFETFTPLTNRQNLALPYEWNSMTHIQQFQIKNGTIIITGRVAEQTAFGSQYIGGAEQWYINDLGDLIKCQ